MNAEFDKYFDKYMEKVRQVAFAEQMLKSTVNRIDEIPTPLRFYVIQAYKALSEGSKAACAGR